MKKAERNTILKRMIICSILLSILMLYTACRHDEHAYNQEVADFKYLKSAATCTESAVYYKSCECGEYQGYTVDLNNEWRKSTDISNLNTSLYDGVYESYANYHVNNGTATMTITINGYDEFRLYVRSNGESTGDYVNVYELDSTSNVKYKTSGKQNSGTTIEAYTEVVYENIGGGTHTIRVTYRKDVSGNSGTDRGYVLIPEEETFKYGSPLGHSYNSQVVCTVCGQENILPGTFTVDSSGNEVQFAKGNLWYNRSTWTWNLEESQLDYQTSWDANHIDKFYWSKNESVAVALNYSDSSRSNDDKFFAAENFTVNGYTKWKTLSLEEWDYLLFTRSTNVTGVETSNARFARVIVNGVIGLLLFPDSFAWNTSTMGTSPALINSQKWLHSEYEWSEVTSYTLSQFEKQEEAGIVFLPCAGYRDGFWFDDVGSYGRYWTSSPISSYYSGHSDYAYDVYFSYGRVDARDRDRSNGEAVRLAVRVE